ncbi:unnamed protein product, partial [Symbiodinium necroappetens]
SRLSQPWQTCACVQKCRAHQNPLHCPSTTADKAPCRRAPRPQRKTTADERRGFRQHVLSTTTADRGCYLLRPQSMSSTERHGHQRPRKSELHCPSTADRAWQEVSAPDSHRECQSNLTICCMSTTTVRLGCHLRMTALPTGIGLTSARPWDPFSITIARSLVSVRMTGICKKCLEKMSGQTCRCSCGHELKIESTLSMIGAYNYVLNALDFITGAKPAGAEGYTAMPSRSDAHSVPSPLLELPPAPSNALPQHRTLCPATTKEMLPPSAPLPAPPSLPSLLGHRRRVSQVADVFKTHLPGEMPRSPMSR